jgi:hypothetical protein
MKVVHNQLPLGERRNIQSQVKEESLRKCPCCKTENESLLHFMQCQSNPAFHSSLQVMQDRMSTNDNQPVCHLIYSGLHHSFFNNEGRFQPSLDAYPHHLQHVIRKALASHERIGWTQATKGSFSVHWRE